MVRVFVRRQALKHDVQADQSVLSVVESLRHRGEDLEAQRLPQVNRAGVGLHYRVELHAAVAL